MGKRKDADESPGVLAGVAVVEDSPVGEEAVVPGDARPGISDPGWEEYVAGHFAPGEVVERDGKRFPKANALWRVMEKLIGPVMEYTARTVKAPANSRDRCAVVEVRVRLKPRRGTELALEFPGRELTYDGVGDATEFNTNEGFDRFAARVAETRAKGRACKTALRLHNMTSFEEMVERPAAYDEEALTSTQLLTLETNARRLGLDLARWIKAQCDEERPGFFDRYGSISKLPKDFGSALCRRAAEMRQAPAGFRGFDPEWRSPK